MESMINPGTGSIYSQLTDITQPKTYLRHNQEVGVKIYHGDLNEATFTADLIKTLAHYTPITMQQFTDWWCKGFRLPERPLLVTFDDGYQIWYTTYKTVLETYNCPAIFFIITGWINGDLVPASHEGDTPLTWAQCIELNNSSLFDVQSHSYSHIDGSGYTYAQALAEMQTAKDQFMTNMGYYPTVHAYPYGFYNDNYIQALSDLDFQFAFRVAASPNASHFPAYKLPINISNKQFELNRDGYCWTERRDYYENMCPNIIYPVGNQMNVYSMPSSVTYATDGGVPILDNIGDGAETKAIKTYLMPVKLGDFIHVEYERKVSGYVSGQAYFVINFYDYTETLIPANSITVETITGNSGYTRVKYDLRISDPTVGWMNLGETIGSDNNGTEIKLKQPYVCRVPSFDSVLGARQLRYQT